MSHQAVDGYPDAKAFEMDFSGCELSEEQKFLFDLKGYLVIPDVFRDDEVQAMKEQVYKIKHEPDSLAPHEKTVPGGASEVILSNPVIKSCLKEFIGEDVLLDGQFVIWRKFSEQKQAPHNGGPMRSAHFHYHVTGGNIYSALTRIVVELNPVKRGEGGTVFLAGSHKSNFHVPPSFKKLRHDNYEPYFETYEASPGSIVVFTENVCHAGPAWRNPDQPRVSVFLSFSEIGVGFHRPKSSIPPEVINGLGPEARWYFRDNWAWDSYKRYDASGKNKLLVRGDGTYIVSP